MKPKQKFAINEKYQKEKNIKIYRGGNIRIFIISTFRQENINSFKQAKIMQEIMLYIEKKEI